MTDYPERDDQSEAETFDETHLTPDGEDIANFDEIPDVADVTQAAGDGEDDAAEDWAAEWSEGELDVPEPDGDVAPLTRLEDRPDNEVATGRPSDRDGLVLDDPASRPASLEPGS